MQLRTQEEKKGEGGKSGRALESSRRGNQRDDEEGRREQKKEGKEKLTINVSSSSHLLILPSRSRSRSNDLRLRNGLLLLVDEISNDDRLGSKLSNSLGDHDVPDVGLVGVDVNESKVSGDLRRSEKKGEKEDQLDRRVPFRFVSSRTAPSRRRQEVKEGLKLTLISA